MSPDSHDELVALLAGPPEAPAVWDFDPEMLQDALTDDTIGSFLVKVAVLQCCLVMGRGPVTEAARVEACQYLEEALVGYRLLGPRLHMLYQR